MNKISFLFGSGISKSSGLPDINTLTKNLICDEYKDNIYNNPLGFRKHIPYYRKFLVWLYNYCSSLNMNNTYEDLFFITQSIEDTINLRTFGNFLVKHFIDTNRFKITKILNDCNEIIINNFEDDFIQFIYKLKDYIKDFIVQSLSISNETNLDYIENFIDILSTNDDYDYEIFTLNHDILIERCISNKEINTGFGNNNRFSIDNFTDSSEKFNIFKLHGSIKWNRRRDENGVDYIHDPKSLQETSKNLDPCSMILIGTFNKYELYSYGIFYDLFHEFRSRLSQTNLLFICGYGFRDEGVNSILLEWMLKDRNNKLVIFHHDEESLINNANVFTGWKWKEFVDCKRIVFKNKKFEGIEWKDINEFLELNIH